MHKQVGGLGLLDLKDALTSFLCKWVLVASKLGDSNLKLLLRSKLEHCNVSKHARLDLDLSLSKRSRLHSRFQSM